LGEDKKNVYSFGDYNNTNVGIALIVDDNNAIIRTLNGGTDQGLYLDFAGQDYFIGNTNRGLRIDFDNLNYYLGDWDGANNGTFIYINDNEDNFRITLNAKRTKFKGYETSEIYDFPDPQKGDFVFNDTIKTLCFYDGSDWQQVVHETM
jgi:hypothetical protein